MSNWYEEIGAAMRKRETAINGVERWKAKVAEAEAEIAELAKQQPTAPVAAPSFSSAESTDSTE